MSAETNLLDERSIKHAAQAMDECADGFYQLSALFKTLEEKADVFLANAEADDPDPKISSAVIRQIRQLCRLGADSTFSYGNNAENCKALIHGMPEDLDEG